MVASFKPNDPFYKTPNDYTKNQWHFDSIGGIGFDGPVNREGIERVWADYRGQGVKLGVYDAGVNVAAPDLAPNYDPSLRVAQANGTINVGTTGSSISHGTSSALLAVAGANGTGGIGVAFGARFAAADASSLSNWVNLEKFDVTTFSMGIASEFRAREFNSWRNAADQGRDGLGTISFKAAGNSIDKGYFGGVNSQGEYLNTDRHVVVVGGTEKSGWQSNYNYGSNLLVSAPTNNTVVGNGYFFDGTSSSTPIAAGVGVLILSADKGLGWRDVQTILAYSATGTGSLGPEVYSPLAYTSQRGEKFAWKWNGADNWNGGGLHYGEEYGYGEVNAFNAVRMAEVWRLFTPVAQTSSNEVTASTGPLKINATLPDKGTWSYSFSVGANITLENVQFTLSIQHAKFSDLRIDLVSAEGTSMMLSNGSGLADASNGFTYTFGINGYRGELSAGNWTLKITDLAAGSIGKVNSISFAGYGAAPAKDDVYHYTDEALATLFEPGQAGRFLLTDSDGGKDWIDAAATSRDLSIDLRPGAISKMGATEFVKIAEGTVIENAIGGDGNDRIVGNDADNTLYGMRGDDSLDGGAGTDTAGFKGAYKDFVISLINGFLTVKNDKWGLDTLVNIEWLKFDDKVVSTSTWLSADTTILKTVLPDVVVSDINGSSGAETLYGSSGNDRMFGLAGNDILKGGAGDDLLDGGVGNDSMDGGAGNDTFVVDSSLDKVVEGLNGGIDTVRTTTLFHLLAANVENLEFTGKGQFNGFGNELANRITGGSGNDALSGNGGADTLVGGDGNDSLIGGAAADTLTGGAGQDKFVFQSVNDSSQKCGIDTITDFVSGADVLDLSAIDANGNVQGNQAFSLVQAFSNQAGQALWQKDGADLKVLADVNGDGIADFQLKLAGVSSLTAGDFIL